jgi:hypothetical protein
VAAGFIGVPSSGRYWYLCTEVLTVCPNNYPDSSFPYRRVRMPLGPTAWSGKVDARSRAAAAQETVDIRSGPHGGARYTPARSTLPTTVWTMLDARVGMVLQQPNRQSRSGTERVLSYGMTLMKFRNRRRGPDPAGCDRRHPCATWMQGSRAARGIQ